MAMADSPAEQVSTGSPGQRPRNGLRVVHAVLSLDLGGLERLVLDLVARSESSGLVPAVLCLERDGRLADDARALGAEVVCADKPPGLKPGLVLKVRRILRRLRPDVIHTHQMGALLYAGWAAAGLAPVVHTEHGKHYEAGGQNRRMARLAASRARRLVGVSRDIADGLIRHRIAPARKVEYVPNGIPLERIADPKDARRIRGYLRIPEDAPVVGTVGRLSAIKRQDVLLKGFALCARAIPNAHLIVVGDGQERPALESLAVDLGLADRIHFAGYRERPEPFFKAMDVFALSSDSEGMPVSLLEAWAAGAAAVTTRVGGLPEIVREGIDGIMVPPGDPEAFGAALAGLLADRDRTRAFGQAGSERVRAEFSLDTMTGRYAEIYREVRAGKKAAAS
jgi:glycosyltransferase involved in cell wall biosynthesis